MSAESEPALCVVYWPHIGPVTVECNSDDRILSERMQQRINNVLINRVKLS